MYITHNFYVALLCQIHYKQHSYSIWDALAVNFYCYILHTVHRDCYTLHIDISNYVILYYVKHILLRGNVTLEIKYSNKI